MPPLRGSPISNGGKGGADSLTEFRGFWRTLRQDEVLIDHERLHDVFRSGRLKFLNRLRQKIDRGRLVRQEFGFRENHRGEADGGDYFVGVRHGRREFMKFLVVPKKIRDGGAAAEDK